METTTAPQLASYVDAVPETVALIIHTTLGAGAGLLFTATGQVTGMFAAIIVGASAPAQLATAQCATGNYFALIEASLVG